MLIWVIQRSRSGASSGSSSRPARRSPAKLSSTKKNSFLVPRSAASSRTTSATGRARYWWPKNVWMAQNSQTNGQPRPVSIRPMGR